MSRKGGRTTGCAASTSAKLVEGRSHKIASKTYKAMMVNQSRWLKEDHHICPILMIVLAIRDVTTFQIS